MGGRGGKENTEHSFAKITPVLEANALWTILDYLNFFLFYRVIRAKFPEEHRLFTDENSSVHCLAVLNRDYPDMFVLLYVDKNNDSAVSIVIYSFSQALLWSSHFFPRTSQGHNALPRPGLELRLSDSELSALTTGLLNKAVALARPRYT